MVGLRWLNSKQVKLERSIQRQAAIDLLAHGPLEPLQLDGHYTLEVSSPGVERPLRTERDFQRFEGKLAKIWVAGKQPDGTSVVQGTLRGVSEGVVAIELEKRDIVRLPLAGIKKAHLVFEAPAQPKKKTGNQKRGSKEAR